MTTPISKDELRKEFLKLCEKHRVSVGFNFSEDTFENEAVALITQQNLQLLERLKGQIEPFAHSDSQNSNDALRFVLSVITSLEKELQENSV